MIKAVGWNNGKHHRTGAGYGLKISLEDRNQFFDRGWRVVQLHIAGTKEPINVNVDKSSFWKGTCRELLSLELGRWMIAEGLAPWPKGKPPHFELIPKDAGVFEVRKSQS
jgi:hypothetical protein